MSLLNLTMLAGIFVVPAVLLWLGQRFRRRTPRQRAIFWGALTGHLVAIVSATLAGTLPPHLWAPDDMFRGLAGYGALLILPLLGGVIGALRASGREGSAA